MDFTDEHVARPATARSRMGRFGEGIYELVSQLADEEQDALLGRAGTGSWSAWARTGCRRPR